MSENTETDMANAGGSSLAKSGSSQSAYSLPAGAKIRISANDDGTIDVVHADAPGAGGFVTSGKRLFSGVTPNQGSGHAARLRALGFDVRVTGSARESSSAARPFLTEVDRLSLLRADEEHRTWYQRAVEGRVGPSGTPSGPLPDRDFVAALETTVGGAP